MRDFQRLMSARTTTKCLVVCLFLEIIFPTVNASAQSRRIGQSSELPPISVKISLPNKTFEVGEKISVRVEISNIGTTDLFLGRRFPQIEQWIYALNLRVRDASGIYLQQSVALPPFMKQVDKSEHFCNALVKDWLALPPGYFFGTTITLDPKVYDGLSKPGRYEVQALYTSMGMEADLYYNRLSLEPDSIKDLPFHSWRGTSSSNSAVFSIVAKRTHGSNAKR